ncbi:dTDP-4-dehydrorhamnose reductase [Methylophaga sp. OBS1]|uniref:dTDP-4-dehydrorhamnose reductase n=1 Tax=Methylophaga sp. OBS1 TaxID=2991933 RepID=UPI00225AB8D9|nr:dTDP-4-dehydrorhamnose reductase [Methylophaga sp. OBS1]MCX4193386.1 dTDP-4-dehydrorhamnose reductase [Methylophaga sp. OBS1]
MSRILLLGATGQIGYELVRSLGPLAKLVMPDREALDLRSDEKIIAEKIRQFQPDLVINAAAYTAVDQAEQEIELAWQVNASAPGAIAKACALMGIPMIHFSTDYVFDGQGSQPWTENDTAHPVNVYGQSKLAGEVAIQKSGAMHCIFRTSWVYGLHGKNFLNTMRRLASEKASLNIVSDQIGSPTWSRHIAEAVSAVVVLSRQQGPSFWQQQTGIYHLTNSGATSWSEFAKAIFEALAAEGQTVPVVNAIATSEYPTAAMRPGFSVLDNARIERQFGIRMPDWRHSLKLVMQDLKL